MLRSKKQGFQTFSDGWGTSYGVITRRLTAPKQVFIHFQEAAVGERRFWDAQISGITIVRAVRVPIDSKVNQGDIFEIAGVQYEVAQKDRKDDRRPESWLLSLRSAAIDYRRADE